MTRPNTIFMLFCVLLISGCTNLAPQYSNLYPGEPNATMIHNSITNPALLADAPHPHVKVLNYASVEIPGEKFYSDYQIRLAKTTRKLTEYRTTEVSHHQATLSGHGVGFGGIISIAYKKHGDLYNVPNYYKKYQWTEISNLKGALFPLRVGNTLSFNYKDLAKNKADNTELADKADQGKIVYEVLAHLDGYKNNAITIPGNVYMIKYSKTTSQDPRLLPQNIYYFSETLGWYIDATYFYNGKPIARYHVVSYQ